MFCNFSPLSCPATESVNRILAIVKWPGSYQHVFSTPCLSLLHGLLGTSVTSSGTRGPEVAAHQNHQRAVCCSRLPLFTWQIFVGRSHQAPCQAFRCSGQNTSIMLAPLGFRVKTKLQTINNHNNKRTTNLTKEDKMLEQNQSMCWVWLGGNLIGEQ